MANPDSPKSFEIVERSPQPFKGIAIELSASAEEALTTEYLKIKIPNFSALKELKKHYLEPLEIAGKQWRILIFPLGNQSDSISLYLDFLGPKVGKWETCAQFIFGLVGEDAMHTREASHRFSEDEIDWGFTQFLNKKIFYSEEKGKRVLVDDTLMMVVGVKVMKDPTGILWHKFTNYDSKAETGYVGLKNQGATCYMNSILQSLFFTNYLRKAVFRLPTDDDDPSKSIPLALQRVFYHLQHSDKPVGTTELTKSFGWDAIDSFMQHDVQEFNRVLCDKLETKMKGTSVEGIINYLLEGKMKSYVKCTDVDFESAREESFYDIQLNVKGFKNLKESFDDYIQVETLDGDNKYFAEGYGLQTAKKGIIFKKFPPVLHLQLKRFEYDMMKDAMVKINDRHEFPSTIDLTDYLEASEKKEPQIYHLHGVLVHSGDLHGGHYCAFIRPEKNGDWFKFDDDRVIKCLPTEALDENFGVDPDAKDFQVKPVSRYSKKFTNAYMLVYIRESDIDKILCPVEEADVSQSVRDRFILEQQQEEQRRKEREEAHLYMNIRVVTEGIMKHHHLTDLCSFDSKTQTPSTALTMRVKKEATYKEFKAMVAEQIGVPVERQRHWYMAKRQNGTIRPDEVIDRFEQEQMGNVKEFFKTPPELRIFVEVSDVEAPADKTEKVEYFEPFNSTTDILLFVKSYDPHRSLLMYEGHFFIKVNERPIDLIAKINTKLGKPANHPSKLYEEVRPTMVEKVKVKDTFQRLEIGTGDILCFCEDAPVEQVELPSPANYYDHILNSVSVNFRERNSPKDVSKHFSLPLSKKMKFDAVSKRVAKELGTQPNMIRFTSHNLYTDGPKLEVKYDPERTLEEMLQPNTYQQMSDVLYYELLDIPLAELEKKKVVPVFWITPKMVEEGPFKLLVDREGTFGDLFELLQKKLAEAKPAPQPSEETPREEEPKAPKEYRFVETHYHKISKVYYRDEPVAMISDASFYIEEIPEDQLQLQEGDHFINVFHFHKDSYSTHGTPFVFLLKANEPFPETLLRLKKRLCVPEKEFEKYKFATVSFGRLKYIEPDDSSTILGNMAFGSNDSLGIDHPEKAPKASRGTEKSIVIRD